MLPRAPRRPCLGLDVRSTEPPKRGESTRPGNVAGTAAGRSAGKALRTSAAVTGPADTPRRCGRAARSALRTVDPRARIAVGRTAFPEPGQPGGSSRSGRGGGASRTGSRVALKRALAWIRLPATLSACPFLPHRAGSSKTPRVPRARTLRGGYPRNSLSRWWDRSARAFLPPLVW